MIEVDAGRLEPYDSPRGEFIELAPSHLSEKHLTPVQ